MAVKTVTKFVGYPTVEAIARAIVADALVKVLTINSVDALVESYDGVKTVCLLVTDDDYAMAEEMIQHITKTVMFEKLRGAADEFDVHLSAEIQRPTVINLRFISFTPSVYRSALRKEKYREMYPTSKRVGETGDIVTLTFTQFECNWKDTLGIFLTKGTDEHGNIVTFFGKNEKVCASGLISAKVKWFSDAHRYTHLHYVKKLASV